VSENATDLNITILKLKWERKRKRICRHCRKRLFSCS